MLKKKKKLFLIILISAAIIFSFVYTVAVGGHYTMYTSIYFPELKENSTSAKFSCDGVVELSGAHMSNNQIYEDNQELVLEFDAVGLGKTSAEVTYAVEYGDNESRVEHRTFELTVIWPGVIFETTYSYINFQSYSLLLFILLFVLAVTLIYMMLSFAEYRRNGDFNYKMIACFGFGIFIGVLLFFLIYKWVNSSLRTFNSFMSVFMDIGFEVFLLIAPLMLILSVVLSISNIWLMKNEGFRPINALGIIFGIVWTAAMGLAIYADIIPAFRRIVNPSFIRRCFLYISCYFGAMFIATVVCAYLSTKYRPPYDRDYIIILGCGIRSDGTLTPLLKGRVDVALDFEKEQYEKTGKHAVFVPSGGQGADEVISESQAMTNYLLEQGVPRERILMEDKSVNTMENMKFSREVIERHAENFKDCRIAFSTTNYHIFRGYILAGKNGFIAKGISAKTKAYFFPNAFLREFIGLLVDRKFTHISFVVLTLAIFVLFDVLLRTL